MRVSQVLKVMDKDEQIAIIDNTNNINQMHLYRGEVRGVTKDSPLNKRHINGLMAFSGILVIFTNERDK